MLNINLDAPAPRMPDGRTPDFSGIWMTETVPCEKTPLEKFGCSDTILGVPIGAIHIAATGEKDIVTGRPLPYQPWALELFQQNLKNNQVQGDTLVVESVGFQEGQWLDALGNPFTDALRLTERIRRPRYGRLDIEITITDPKAYTGPFTVRRHLKRTDDVDPFEYVCNENEKSLQRMLNSAK